jgi:hypothetical protein
MLTRLLAASKDHVGTGMEEFYGRAAEHIDVLLQRHEHEAYNSDGRTNSPMRLKRLLRDFGSNSDTTHAISNEKVQQGASAATKAAAAALRRGDNAAPSCNSEGGSAEPSSWLVDSESSEGNYRDSDSCSCDSDGDLDSASSSAGRRRKPRRCRL